MWCAECHHPVTLLAIAPTNQCNNFAVTSLDLINLTSLTTDTLVAHSLFKSVLSVPIVPLCLYSTNQSRFLGKANKLKPYIAGFLSTTINSLTTSGHNSAHLNLNSKSTSNFYAQMRIRIISPLRPKVFHPPRGEKQIYLYVSLTPQSQSPIHYLIR